MPKFDVRYLGSYSPVHKRNNGASNITPARLSGVGAKRFPAIMTRASDASKRQSSVISAIIQVRSHGVFLAKMARDSPRARSERGLLSRLMFSSSIWPSGRLPRMYAHIHSHCLSVRPSVRPATLSQYLPSICYELKGWTC